MRFLGEREDECLSEDTPNVEVGIASATTTNMMRLLRDWILGSEEGGGWQHTFFVTAWTFTQTMLGLTLLYLWWANRQFHFQKRQKDGSRLSGLATREDALELKRRQSKQRRRDAEEDASTVHIPRRQRRRRRSRKSRVRIGAEDDVDQDDESDGNSSQLTDDKIDDGDEENSENKYGDEYQGMLEEDEEEADLSDYETDKDEDDNKNTGAGETKSRLSDHSLREVKTTHVESSRQLPADKRRYIKDLTSVISNMEVFSYLSSDAFDQCLGFMEYVDLAQGDSLFDEQSYDGSLYAVVTGQVKCQFELPQKSRGPTTTKTTNDTHFVHDDDSDDDSSTDAFVSFTAGDGDVVTSLLSMLAGLVRQCQQQQQDRIEIRPVVPAGIRVNAIGVAPTTQLVRVPPQCFLQMLDTFPSDVYRIAQTIIARMQRVTLQTVVRCLGLQKEIVQRKPYAIPIGQGPAKEAWQRLQPLLATLDTTSKQPPSHVALDAALVAAAIFLGPNSNDDASGTTQAARLNGVISKLQQEASIITLPPGRTLLEMGEAPDAIYLVLRGCLDVGMKVDPGGSNATTPALQKSTSIRRASVHTTNKQAPGLRGKHSSRDAAASKNTPADSRSRTTQNKRDPRVSKGFSRIYRAPVGEVMGTLSCFTGDVSIVTVRNSSDSDPAILYKLSKDLYNSFLAEHPGALTECLGSILDRLGSPIVCLLDWNVEWMHVQAGEDVVLRGEECDAMYAVLNGRLRAAALYSDHQSTKKLPTTPPLPQSIDRLTSDGTTASFLGRAKQRLRNRKGLLKFIRKTENHPRVANAPPPLSRRMMNSAGEEVQGEEFGRGAIIGEVEILTGADWSSDVYASRHSELARVPVSVLNTIIRMFPRAGLHLARVVASQIQRNDARKRRISMKTSNVLVAVDSGNRTQSQAKAAPSTLSTPTSLPLGKEAPTGGNVLPSYGLNISTIAVVPLLEGYFDVNEFSTTLQQTLQSSIAPTKLMTKSFAREELGDEVFGQRNAMHSLKMTRLCGDMEENYRLVVYQAEMNYTWWTRLCIQQADCILLVVRAEEAPPQKKVEACLSWAFAALNVKIQLVVLQSQNRQKQDDNEEEDETVFETMESSDALNDWSEERYWIAGHHLVRMPFSKHVLDFRRLCRRVTGRSVGVVLGGGGARGLAHLGVIKALNEAGVTIDFVGGTSQGAYVGALLAMQPDDYPALVRSARQMADSMSNTWEKLCDLTLPLVSFFSGYRFNRGIQKSLGRRRIQDLVCNFFCVSTDIRNNVQVVHTKGVCWRYVRASMTLQSYLPPLSEDGTLLVDGGYMNVLPADVMKRQMRARTVIAVDVSLEVTLDNYEYGTHLNGWWMLWNSWNPFIKTVNIPSMGDISERLAWVSGERHKKKVREHIDLFLQPPVGNFGVLEYDKFDEIVQLGYEYAKPRVDNFVKKYPHMVS